MYLSEADIKAIQEDINNFRVDPEKIKQLIHEHFLIRALAEEVHNTARAFHQERKKRTVSELEIRAIIGYMRRIAYHMLRKHQLTPDVLKEEA